MTVHHMGLMCTDPTVTERFYADHFGFRRVRAFSVGPGDKIIFLKSGDFYLELFKATVERTGASPTGAGPEYPGWRHLAFKVDDVDAKLAQMGSAARVTAGPMGFDDFIVGWKTAWIADPDGNIVEISQGFTDSD